MVAQVVDKVANDVAQKATPAVMANVKPDHMGWKSVRSDDVTQQISRRISSAVMSSPDNNYTDAMQSTADINTGNKWKGSM